MEAVCPLRLSHEQHLTLIQSVTELDNELRIFDAAPSQASGEAQKVPIDMSAVPENMLVLGASHDRANFRYAFSEKQPVQATLDLYGRRIEENTRLSLHGNDLTWDIRRGDSRKLLGHIQHQDVLRYLGAAVRRPATKLPIDSLKPATDAAAVQAIASYLPLKNEERLYQNTLFSIDYDSITPIIATLRSVRESRHITRTLSLDSSAMIARPSAKKGRAPHEPATVGVQLAYRFDQYGRRQPSADGSILLHSRDRQFGPTFLSKLAKGEQSHPGRTDPIERLQKAITQLRSGYFRDMITA